MNCLSPKIAHFKYFLIPDREYWPGLHVVATATFTRLKRRGAVEKGVFSAQVLEALTTRGETVRRESAHHREVAAAAAGEWGRDRPKLVAFIDALFLDLLRVDETNK